MPLAQRGLNWCRLVGVLWVCAGVAMVGVGSHWAGGAGAAVACVLWWLGWFLRDRRQSGMWASADRREEGVVFFAEAARWLCIRWGFARVARGLDAGGVRGSIELFRWSRGWRGFLAIPSLWSGAHMRARGQRLAEKIARYRQQYPERPVHVIGYSCGAYVVVSALECLPKGVSVSKAILLAPTISPGYDLSTALGHVGERMICFHSYGDWVINGIGPLLFGTADRRHCLSAGMVGFRPAAGGGSDRMLDVRHGMRFLRWGYLGDHFTVAGSGLAKGYLAGEIAASGAIRPAGEPS